MNTFRLGSLATGLLGVYLLIDGFSDAFGYALLLLSTFFFPSHVDLDMVLISKIYSLLVAVLTLLPGILLIWFRREITRRWLMPDEDSGEALGDQPIAALGFSLLGIFLIARGIYMTLMGLLTRPLAQTSSPCCRANG